MRVVIRSTKDPEYAHVVCHHKGEWHCERVASGASINMGADYYAAIEEDDD